MAGRKKTPRVTLERAHRQQRALNLYQAGASYRAIADKLGVSSSQIHRDIADALAEVIRPPAQAVLDIELARLDQLQLGLWPEAVRGNVKVVGMVLQIMDRRARYLGLDKAAPPDTSGEARAALESFQAAILATAERLGPDPDAVIGGSEAL